MLAYQAASIELAYKSIVPFGPPGFVSKALLGTVHEPDVNAMSKRVGDGEYQIVLLNSGLVDFVYQAAKSIVAASAPKLSASGQRLAQAHFDARSIAERLRTDPEPAERLYRTLEAYFFGGYPRAFSDETVPDEQHPVLSTTVGMAERWIIGHEYAHGFAPPMADAPAEVNVDIAEEFFADANATIATVWSAAQLDGMPPEVSVGGAVFALACMDVLGRAYRILRTGDERQPEVAHPTHPKPRDRATEVMNRFLQFFDVQYVEDKISDLSFVLREQAPAENGFTAARRETAFSYANSLLAVWACVSERLREDNRQKRPLHPIWP
jgi:hypothetical protein